MALTEIYVDPSIAADSGAGTVGDPYGDLEYAIEQETFDTTNGTRVNIKAGTDEVLAAQLATALADTSVSVAWAPSGTAPLIFQGYTTAAGDGGKGGISGGGAVPIISSTTLDHIKFIDLHLHNCGANYIVSLDDGCAIMRCELDNATGNRAIDLDLDSNVIGNYIHNVGDFGIVVTSGVVEQNILKNGTNKFSWAIRGDGADATVIRRNIISIDGTSSGIDADNKTWIDQNSIYSAAGTGTGIDLATAGNVKSVRNNLVEGFSGTGGVGIDAGDTGIKLEVYGGNAVYDCETEYVAPDRNFLALGDNETLTASPFTDAANDDFSPVDTGNVKEGSLPAAFHTIS